MLTHPTLDMLRDLGLHGMAKGFQDLDAQPEARALDHGEWLAILLDHEATMRRQKRFEARARAARLRHDAQVEDVDFRADRGLDRVGECDAERVGARVDDDILVVEMKTDEVGVVGHRDLDARGADGTAKKVIHKLHIIIKNEW